MCKTRTNVWKSRLSHQGTNFETKLKAYLAIATSLPTHNPRLAPRKDKFFNRQIKKRWPCEVSRTASAKIRQNDGGRCEGRGIAALSEAWARSERSVGKECCSPWFCLIVRRDCARRSISADMGAPFGYFWRDKSN